MEELMIRIENVAKVYKLGQIGGTTLRDELQRQMAKLRHQEDPTKRIGTKDYNKGEIFRALDGISLDVKKGERIGIIGHNGAGKSTLLKLLSRVTAPTEGSIGLNGKVASMLEVGTGFHGELTGRENIYMNGAILGMTKKEIDAKMEDIIEFSECRKFIDTPVKRYSSGMYVKLAFSVAAHLDSEIMIMDEVLAVGDMAFQQKCLDKMNDVSKREGRTILYVSHNMNTIRQLCERVVVLDHGKIVFDGDVETGIKKYMNAKGEYLLTDIDLSHDRMRHLPAQIKAKITHLKLTDKQVAIYSTKERLDFCVTIKSYKDIRSPLMRFEFRYSDDAFVGTAIVEGIQSIQKDSTTELKFSMDISSFTRGKYKVLMVLYEMNEYGSYDDLDAVLPAFVFAVEDDIKIDWNTSSWGHIRFSDIKLLQE